MTLEARDLAYGHRGRTLGRGVSLTLREGEVMCLLGPNGTGKTTLMRTLLGLLPPHGGKVALDGKPIAAWPARERARRLAYVPQAAESYFDFSVLEMAELGRTAHLGVFSSPGRGDRAGAQRAVERLGLAALAERPIHRVSGGERQLALIARALATDATFLLMDEPTANLDFANQALILGEIARLRDAGAAVLFTTHLPDHALRIADRVAMLRHGELLAEGPVDAVVDSARLTALYGRPVEVAEVRLADGTRHRACIATGGPMP